LTLLTAGIHFIFKRLGFSPEFIANSISTCYSHGISMICNRVIQKCF
jgi:hypothetical protein